MSYREITGDWAGTIAILCSEDYPPRADSRDVTLFWRF